MLLAYTIYCDSKKYANTIMQKCSENDVISHIKYCDKVVKKICRNKNIYGDMRDELLSEGRIGLARALEKYDANRGASLETYIYKNVKNEINRHLRNIVGKNPDGKKRAAFDAMHITYIDNIDIFYNVSNNINKRIEYKDLIQKIYSRLPLHYVEIINLYNVEGFTFDEISQQLDYTYQNAHALYHRAILKFKKIYKELI